MVPNDLQDYLDGAERLSQRSDLYIPPGELDRVEFYQYAPSYALAFVPFLSLSPATTVFIHTIFHLFAYVGLFWVWYKMFQQWKFEECERLMVWTLPVWLLFSSFWTDLGYLNIYIIVAFLSSLLVKSVIDEKLGLSVVWLTLIVQAKPHWAFALVVPLLLGRYRFFARLIGYTLLSYFLLSLAVAIFVGPTYGLQQYIGYFRFLGRIGADFPWRGHVDGFLGYNHSIKQILVYIFDLAPWSFMVATLLKISILLPLVIVALRHLRRPLGEPGWQVPQRALDLAFVFYLGAFIWLDMVWELSLGVPLFVYLLGTLEQRASRSLAMVSFLPYALLDPWRVFSLVFLLLGWNVIAPGPYVLTDPAIYFPLIMLSILVFYVLLIRRLWIVSESQLRPGIWRAEMSEA
jgi:hypothetical protein